MSAATTSLGRSIIGIALVAGWSSVAAVAQVCVTEEFNYADGAIVGQGGWTGNATDAEIAVSNNTVQIKSTLSGVIVGADLPVDCEPCEDGIITVSFRIKGDPDGNTSTLWGIYFDDPNNVNLARFFRTSQTIAGRTGGLGLGYLTDAAPLTLTGYDQCKAVIDTKNSLTYYYLNDVLFGINPPNFVNPVSTGMDAQTNRNPARRIGRIRLERQATATATGVITIDDIQITSCPGTCSAKVTPLATQTAYAQSGGSATPATAVFTVTNDNTDSLSYTVAETLADGTTANDYSWFSLDKSGGGPLSTAQTDDVTVTFDTTGLSPGAYVGYITFTDGCTPARTYTRSVKLFVETCLTEEFNYPDGRLAAAPGWSGPVISTQAVYPARIEGGALRIVGDPWPALGGSTSSPVFVHQVANACPSCSENGGLVSVKIKAKGGALASNFWRMHVRDAAGIEFGDWQGQGTQVRGRIDLPGGTVITDWVPLDTLNYKELEMRINPDDTRTIGGIPPNATLFLVDGVAITTVGPDAPTPHFNPIPYGTLGTGDAVARVEITRVHNTGATGGFVLLDDLSVGRCTEQCNIPVFDVRDTSNATVADGKVTIHDFNVFQNECATGPTPGAAVFDALPFECRCMDVDGNQAVDMNDYGRFQRCYTGPDGTASATCDD